MGPRRAHPRDANVNFTPRTNGKGQLTLTLKKKVTVKTRKRGYGGASKRVRPRR